ncbi:MAG: PBP1A family penicillin-binding protein [Patescibacteria group bacterium]
MIRISLPQFTRIQKTKLLTYLAVGSLVGVIGFSILTTIVFAVFSFGLPDPSKVIRRDGFSTIIYDKGGKTLYDVYQDANRIPLDIKSIPKTLQEATVSIEDKDFYKHSGYDLLGIIRAIRNSVLRGGIAGGGSTITQQVVKNTLLSREQTASRKIRELILANQIETKYSKEQILQMYLNEAPYGGSLYGAESAAQKFFGKSVKDLTLLESAILAGLPQSPTSYYPFGSNPKAYVERTKNVLRRMREDGYINYQQETDSIKQLTTFQFASASAGIKAPHFVFYVKDQLVKMFGEDTVEGGGLRVTTTLDLDWQEATEKIVNEEIIKLKKAKVGNGAAVVLDPKTGEIKAMVGSYDYFDKDYGSYNVATALRQPGSSGKPFVYATALSKGYTASSMLMDVKTSYPSNDPKNPIYTPENYNLKYAGPIQLRFALGNSINTIAVKLTALSGVKDIMQNGFNAGLSTWEPTTENMKNVGLSLALGGREVRLLELTGAYGAFANGGLKVDPLSILKVTDAKGKVLYEYKPVTEPRVFSPEVSFIVSHILSDDNARKDVFGANSLLVVPSHTVAVKTGTTDQKRDNWTLGYTPGVVVGVWVGNNDNTIMSPTITSGVTGAAPIWNRIMKTILVKTPNEEFIKPDSVVAMPVDTLGGGLPHGNDGIRSEYFTKGTEPISQSSIFKSLKVSKSNGKLANDMEIKSGDYDSKEFVVIEEQEPLVWVGLPIYDKEKNINHWQDAINKWLADNKKGDAKWNPPTDKSDAKQNDVVVNVESPKDQQRIDSNSIAIKAKAFSARDIVQFVLEVDGSEKINKAVNSLDETLSLSNGSHELKFKAVDSGGNAGGATIKIGINAAWDSTPTPTPTP